MLELMNSLTEFNEVRFSAYRTALKLRAVQKKLCREFNFNKVECFVVTTFEYYCEIMHKISHQEVLRSFSIKGIVSEIEIR